MLKGAKRCNIDTLLSYGLLLVHALVAYPSCATCGKHFEWCGAVNCVEPEIVESTRESSRCDFLAKDSKFSIIRFGVEILGSCSLVVGFVGLADGGLCERGGFMVDEIIWSIYL